MNEPVVDALLAKVKAMLARGKTRGFVTYDQLNQALPPEHYSSEQIEDTMALLSEMGIQVVEGENDDDEDDDPVDVDPRSPQGPSLLRGEAELAKSPSSTEPDNDFTAMPIRSTDVKG